MFIVPISGAITPLQSISNVEPKQEDENLDINTASFLDVFKNVIDNAQQTQAQKNEDAVKVMLGEIDDLHTIQANIEKAAIAMELLVSVRNKAVDAYSEIMRMTV